MKTGQSCRKCREAINLRLCGALESEEAARVEAHLAACAECRLYAEEVQATAAGLRWLGSRDVEARPGFRARWTRAVGEAARPSSFAATAGAIVAWGRGLLRRNLRPALGVASLWILALVFRLSAPAVAPSAQTIVARAPVEIYRVLTDREQLVAGELGRQFAVPVAPRTQRSIHPQSERSPTQPAARLEHEAGVAAALCALSPNSIGHGRPSMPHTV